MENKKKKSTVINCVLSQDVYDLLEEFVKETGISKKGAVERAVKEYIEKYNKTKRL